MPKSIDLTQALSARICHDLAGPVGTIDNCIGLLDNADKSIGEKAHSLVVEESSNLVRRLKLFRSAFGLSDGEKDMSLVNMSKLVSNLFDNSGIKLKIHIDSGLIYLDSQLAKAGICLSLIAADNINSKGSLDLYIQDEIDVPVRIDSSGQNINLKSKYIEILKGDTKIPVSVENCREHYVNKLCSKKGYKLLASKSGGQIAYSLKKIR